MISPPLVLWCVDCTIEREDINDDLLERILITPTPSNYRVGIRPLHFQFHCSSSPLSTSSASDAFEGLTLRLLELLGFSRLINLEQESKSWKHHQMPITTHFQSANKLVFTKGRQYPMWPSTK